MQKQRTLVEAYKEFVKFVQSQAELEQVSVRKRMFNLFFWCLILPAFLSVILLLALRFDLIPRATKQLIEWLPLLFPLSYSIYYLGSEVLADIPKAFRRGGIASALEHALDEADWRDRIIERMNSRLDFDREEWTFIAATFEMDLKTMQNRMRFLTALGGAVFFLILQGFDAVESAGTRAFRLNAAEFISWFENTSAAIWQLVGLGFFLIMLYLAGAQTHYFLERYLNCVRLVLVKKEQD